MSRGPEYRDEVKDVKGRKLAALIVGSTLFGLAFGLSQEMPFPWLRVLVAALGGAILGIALALESRM